MCEPTTLVALTGMSAGAASTTALAIQGVSAVTSAASAIDQSNKQNEAVARNAQSAKDAYFLKSKQTNLRILQEQTQASRPSNPKVQPQQPPLAQGCRALMWIGF